MTKLDRVRELAQKVTPGTWLLAENAPDVVLPEGGHLCWTRANSDAAYISALDPQTVLAMIEVIEAAKALTAKLERGPKKEWNAYDAALAKLEQLA